MLRLPTSDTAAKGAPIRVGSKGGLYVRTPSRNLYLASVSDEVKRLNPTWYDDQGRLNPAMVADLQHTRDQPQRDHPPRDHPPRDHPPRDHPQRVTLVEKSVTDRGQGRKVAGVEDDDEGETIQGYRRRETIYRATLGAYESQTKKMSAEIVVLKRTIADLASKLGELLALERQRSSRKGEKKVERASGGGGGGGAEISEQIRELEATLQETREKLEAARATGAAERKDAQEATRTSRNLTERLLEANARIEDLTTQLAHSRAALRDSETTLARVSAELVVWRTRDNSQSKTRSSGGKAAATDERKRAIERLERELVAARADFERQRATLEATRNARDLAILKKNELQTENGIMQVLIDRPATASDERKHRV